MIYVHTAFVLYIMHKDADLDGLLVVRDSSKLRSLRFYRKTFEVAALWCKHNRLWKGFSWSVWEIVFTVSAKNYKIRI